MVGYGAEVVEHLICLDPVLDKIELSEEMRLKNINTLGWYVKATIKIQLITNKTCVDKWRHMLDNRYTLPNLTNSNHLKRILFSNLKVFCGFS